MRALIFAIILVALPLGAAARTIQVQTGEHATFTRVVLTLPEPAGWAIGRTEGGYGIRIDAALGYDLLRFYDLVPRVRIADVSQDAEGRLLSLAVDCLCNLDAFVYLDRFLVVDVRDGPPDPTSAFEQALQPDDATAEALPATRRFEIRANPVIPLFPTADPVPPVLSEAPAVPPSAATERSKHDPVAPPAGSDAPTSDVGQIGAEIAQSVARALSEGLLGPETNGPTSEGNSTLVLGGPGMPGLTARTSSQRLDELTRAENDGILSCLDDAHFAIETWADDRPFHLQLRDLSLRAFGEDRDPDKLDLLALARLHLHFGFAEEARQLLVSDGRQSLENRTFLALSQIVQGQVTEDTGFGDQIACAGRVSLWAFLAQMNPLAENDIPTAAIVTEYKRLPEATQSIIGPRLVDAFLAREDVDAAMQVMGRIPETGADPSDVASAASDLAIAQDRPDAAVAILDAALAEGRGISPPVLTRLLVQGAEAPVALDPATLSLAEAVVFETQGTEEADALARAQFRFHLASGAFAQAAQMIERGGLLYGQEDSTGLKSEFAMAAVAGMTDMAFGRYAWNDALLPAGVAERAAIAERLADLGFGERAAELRVAVDPEAPRRTEAPAERVVPPGQVLQDRASGDSSPPAPFPESGATTAPAVLASLRALVNDSERARTEAVQSLAAIVIPEGQ